MENIISILQLFHCYIFSKYHASFFSNYDIFRDKAKSNKAGYTKKVRIF